MKPIITTFAALTFAAALCATSAFAAETKTPQQQKFGDCATAAHNKGLKGDEYKSYMSTCSKADAAAPAAPAKPMTQQEKMTACNADAGNQH